MPVKPPRRVYTPEFKREVVQYKETTGATFTEVGRKYGIHFTLVSDWCKGGRPHGRRPRGTGEVIPRRSYTLAFKREVVDYRRTTGFSATAVAGHFGIPAHNVMQWCAGRGMSYRGGDEVPITRQRRKSGTLSVTVAATQRALEKVNGHAPPAARGGTGSVVREVLLRLRSLGIDIQQITANGEGGYEVSYTVKETIDL